MNSVERDKITIMAAALKKKIEPDKRIESKNEGSVSDGIKKSSRPPNFGIYDLAVLFISFFSVIIDLFTDLVLVVQYANQGFKAFAVGTFVLIFLPSVVVQFFSLRWHIVDKTASTLHWVLHFCLLGIFHRYVQIVKAAFSAYKSKKSSDIQSVLFDQSDLCMLHLFESFLESAPQLVLQIYVITLLNELKFWTGVSALASLLSLAWALAAYTKAQRRARANKNFTSWPGLLFQAIWRTGMLISRISTLVLGAYCFGNYVFLIIAIHWIGMTMWIIYQKTDFCETFWEEKIYNAVVGVVYCFCFFNLQEGQSRWRALIFYSVIIFQNLTCLTIFLIWFGEKTPKLAITGFIAIVGGTITGSTSMLIYYRFFHPTGVIKFVFTPQIPQSMEPSLPYSTMTLRSLKKIRCESPVDLSHKCSQRLNSENALNKSYLSDSIVIVEESMSNVVDIKNLQNSINEVDENKLRSSDKKRTDKNEKIEIKVEAYKRRAICSSDDLITLINSKAESENGNLKLTGTDEASSKIHLDHDYENLCALNIAREAWGLRSWRGYSDIETWLHDDSVVHDRRLDTLTSSTSSDRSANTLQKEYERTRQDDCMDATAEDLAHCEYEESPDDILDQYSIESLSVAYPLARLDPIFEELELTSTNNCDLKMKNGSESILVATIDQIRRNNFVQSRYPPSESIYGSLSVLGDIKKPKEQRNWKKVSFATKLLTFPEDERSPKEATNTGTELEKKKIENMKSVIVKPEESEIKVEEKMTLKAKKREINISAKKNSDLKHKEICKEQNMNKENIPTVAGKINYWNKILSAQIDKNEANIIKVTPPKKENVSEKKPFLLRVLIPPNYTTFKKKTEGS